MKGAGSSPPANVSRSPPTPRSWRPSSYGRSVPHLMTRNQRFVTCGDETDAFEPDARGARTGEQADAVAQQHGRDVDEDPASRHSRAAVASEGEERPCDSFERRP